MDLHHYQLLKEKLRQQAPIYRALCQTCRQPSFSCYCEFVKTIDVKIKFVILMHPIEAKRRIATGRMAHLCLENSELIIGQDYTLNARVNEILDDQTNHCLILYPGQQALNISKTQQIKPVFQNDRNPVLFVIDGTWATARKTMFQSANLKSVQKICFTPERLSQFKVRKQPAPECYSTIEAIHQSLELLGHQVGLDTQTRLHDQLLFVFDKMVERQLDFIRESRAHPKPTAYRRERHSSPA